MSEIVIDIWLYGRLARYGGEADQGSFANLKCTLPAGSTVAELLDQLGLPTEERGITFVNGQLSAMPGLQPDLEHELYNGDRVGIFDTTSMWPFQYRHGAAMIEEMAKAMHEDGTQGLHHVY